jgi:hypothetical protein
LRNEYQPGAEPSVILAIQEKEEDQEDDGSKAALGN